MDDVLSGVRQRTGTESHARWVRVLHWVTTASFLALAFSGFVILMAHPRLYWGDAGNDLTPALLELPISRNFKHNGWTAAEPFFAGPADAAGATGPVSAGRTYEIFNQNGWGRSLHFLAAWCLVLPGLGYLLAGITSGHFRSHIWPRLADLSPGLVCRDVAAHVRLRIPPATGGPQYGVLQKLAYSAVVFAAAPLIVLSGLTMAPAVTSAWPWLLGVFGGYQSARTIHFFTFAALTVFVFVHLVMIVLSGFRRQLRAMTLGK